MKTIDTSAGYLRLVYPMDVIKQYYMLGDHWWYCPVQFR